MTDDELRQLSRHRRIRQIAFLSRDLEKSMPMHHRPFRRHAAVLVLAAGALAIGPPLARSSDAPVTDKAVMAFRDVCLATAPSFDKAMAAARKFGVKPQMDLGSGMVGMAPGNAFSVQVRAKKECAVTAESDPDPGLDEQFLSVVARAGGLAAGSLKPGSSITLTLRGRIYVVRHDRRGAEAYVIIDAAGL